MGLFDRLYYGKAGKADYTERDMPKTRISLFFLVLKDHFFDLVKVNALQLIFWLPFLIWTFMSLSVIQNIDTATMLAAEDGTQTFMHTLSAYVMTWLIGCIPCLAITGPSSAGSAYIMRNWARDQHAFLFSDFKDAFRSNWKQALGISVINAFIPAVGYTAIAFYAQMSSENAIMMFPMMLTITVLVIWVLMLPLLYPMLVGYELKFGALLKNALLMSAARFPHMILARLITFIPIAVLIIGIYMGSVVTILVVSLYYLLFGFAFSRLVYASFANGVFDKYLNPHIEGAAVGQGLRPQMDEDELFDDDEEEDEICDDDDEA